MATEEDLKILKCNQTSQRMLVTKYSDEIALLTSTSKEDDVLYYIEVLEESLRTLGTLTTTYLDTLADDLYEKEFAKNELYKEKGKRALISAKKLWKKTVPEPYTPHNPTTSTRAKLMTLHIEPFTGEIECWPTFWQQFSNSVDSNTSLSTIDKHIYLRSYLEGQPKFLVDGILITGDTYETTKEILIKKYGDTNKIVQSHLSFLDNIKPSHHFTAESLNNHFLECNRRVQALQALGADIISYGKVLTPKILQGFPTDLCNRWITYAKRHGLEFHDMKSLMSFFEEEVDSWMTTTNIKTNARNTLPNETNTTAFHIQSNKVQTSKVRSVKPFCVFCKIQNEHWSQNCNTVASLNDRISLLKDNNRCFLCLNRNHNWIRKDKAFCRKCKKKHHEAICPAKLMVTKPEDKNLPSTSTTVSISQVDIPHLPYTYLQTAQIWVLGENNKRIKTRCLFDTGSQSSFIHTDLVQTLNLQVINNVNLRITAFENENTQQIIRRQLSFFIANRDNSSTIQITAFESSNNYLPHSSVSVKDFPSNLYLADPIENAEPGHQFPITLLIGGDQYWKIIKAEAPHRISNTLTMIPSELGWIVSGLDAQPIRTELQTSSVNYVSYEENSNLQEDLEKLWNLEALGIMDNQNDDKTLRNQEVLKNFRDSFCVDEGRLTVSLPWKEVPQLNSDNKCIALQRLKKLQQNFEQI